MKQLLLDVFSETPNLAVVGRPGREDPAILIPGDDLHKLWGSAASILNFAQHGSQDSVLKEAEGLEEILRVLVGYYHRTLHDHQLKPPFNWP